MELSATCRLHYKNSVSVEMAGSETFARTLTQLAGKTPARIVEIASMLSMETLIMDSSARKYRCSFS